MESTKVAPPTPADLRAAIAREQLRLYVIAARVGVHPGKLSAVLGGRRPMSSTFAVRVWDVIQMLARERVLAETGHEGPPLIVRPRGNVVQTETGQDATP
jgi:hypothetical protein